jgi:hypothetical protein
VDHQASAISGNENRRACGVAMNGRKCGANIGMAAYQRRHRRAWRRRNIIAEISKMK